MGLKLKRRVSLILVLCMVFTFSIMVGASNNQNVPVKPAILHSSSSASYAITIAPSGIPGTHYVIMMDKAGWAVIKATMAGATSAAAGGTAVALLCGVAASSAGPVGALIAAVIGVQAASVEVQFALGADIASMYI